MSRSFWLSAAIERQRERQCSAKFLFPIFPLNPSISMSFTNQNGGSVPSVLSSPFFIWNGRCCLWQVTCLVKLSLLVALFFFCISSFFSVLRVSFWDAMSGPVFPSRVNTGSKESLTNFKHPRDSSAIRSGLIAVGDVIIDWKNLERKQQKKKKLNQTVRS